MSASRKGIILAALQLAIVASLAAKYTIDRGRFPQRSSASPWISFCRSTLSTLRGAKPVKNYGSR
jgi:hypothetical protein